MINSKLFFSAILAIAIGYYVFILPPNQFRMLEKAKAATVTVISVADPANPGRISQGSGAIISADGEVITNHHVIEDGKLVYVVLHDHRIVDAEIVGSSEETDLALLKIKAEGLQYFKFSQSPLRVGEGVYALGAPIFLEQTISYGILSALKREFRTNPNSLTYAIQSNVACNPGSSGGPLINQYGELLGINSWTLASWLGNVSIPNTSFCFSVPNRVVHYVVDYLRQNKEIKQKTIGATYANVDYLMAKKRSFDKLVGVVVLNVKEGSPAVESGLKQNDIIIEYNKEEINSAHELNSEINLTPIGTTVPTVIWRDQQEHVIQLKPQYIPSPNPLPAAQIRPIVEQ